MTSSLTMFEAAIWIKSVYTIKLLLKIKKRENMKIQESLT